MKSYAITIAIAILSVVSTQAANPARRRTQRNHKSVSDSRVHADETYDPYLGMGGSERTKSDRRLAGHEQVASMSMSMSMSMGGGMTPPTEGGAGAPTPGTPTPPTPTPPSPTPPTDAPEKDSSASVVGTAVSILAATGAMMLL